ncbi:hypothetical protein BA20089_08625 [Bifidobacterium asteroides DSM 20089]|uniref:Uncharacterized protein n=1 Tax=Bifidobacterium asteroides DSM 20089 TaxID=1437594 RepID=A0AAD0EXE3_9BIFI|nr:hypothetical protein BA20089_08625 [Bifidobacterium asteroides DSM 20089]
MSHQRDAESQGLAGTGPAPSQNVTASQGIRQGIPLDGEGPGLAVLAQDANQGLRHPQLVKSHRFYGRLAGIGRIGIRHG